MQVGIRGTNDPPKPFSLGSVAMPEEQGRRKLPVLLMPPATLFPAIRAPEARPLQCPRGFQTIDMPKTPAGVSAPPMYVPLKVAHDVSG